MSQFTPYTVTLGQVFDRTAEAFAMKEAVIHPSSGTCWTWKTFSDHINAAAKGLMALGVEVGDKIAVWAPNCPQWLVLMFAAAKIGAILIPVNTNYQQNDLAYVLQQSGCDVLAFLSDVQGGDLEKRLRLVVPEAFERSAGKVFFAPRAPALKTIISLNGHTAGAVLSLSDVEGMASQINDETYLARQSIIQPEDIVNMQYTSGTTGFPKGVMLTHVSIINNARSVGQNLQLSCEDTICLPVPLFHCVGCVLGALSCVYWGSAMVLMEGFSPVSVMNAVEEHRCTGLYGVPSFFQAILHHRSFSSFNFGCLKKGIIAGAICPEPLMRDIIFKMGIEGITICYGLTEGSPVLTQTTREDPLEQRVTTVGKPLPGIEVAILDKENNARLKLGETGEVCCRGYNVMAGYYNMDDETSTAIDNNGWLHTGDLGSLDENGFLRLTGRIKDMIIRGGENIYPKEIEDFIRGMDGIADVQIVGVPSNKYGEEVGAFLVLDEGKFVTLESIRNFCKGHIAWFKIPRYLHVLNDFPKTSSGKIQKYKLKELARECFAS